MRLIDADVLMTELDVTYLYSDRSRQAIYRKIKEQPTIDSQQPEWEEMTVICDCCGHTIHIKKER